MGEGLYPWAKEALLPPRNFCGLFPENADFEASKVVVLPVPYDSTASYRTGARHGPLAIIEASQFLELYDRELRCEPYLAGIHTMPEVDPAASGPEQMVRRVYDLARELVQRDKLVVTLGGEHTPTVGVLDAYLERFPDLSVLQLDAHADLRDEYQGSRFSHACVGRRIWERCRLVQVGVRSVSKEEEEFIASNGVGSFPYEGADSLGPESLGRITQGLGQHVYVTIDLDVFDPSFMPAVGTPEPGGIGWHEAMTILRAVGSTRRIVGFDVMEFTPNEGPPSCAFSVAKLVYKLMGYALYLPGGKR